MKKIKILTFRLLGVMLLLSSIFTFTNLAIAQSNQEIVDQMIIGVGGVNLPSAGNKGDIDANTEKIIGRIINAFLGIFGVLFLGLMVFGGFKWMIAQGREEEVQKAKTIIQAAIIGFGIAVSSYAVARFVTIAFFNAAGG